MTTPIESIWAGRLLMTGMIAISVAVCIWELRGYGTPPTETYWTLIGLYILLAVWDLYNGRPLLAGIWFAFAVAWYYIIRDESPPGGESVGSGVRLPKWLKG